jgi:hypothetical protein
VTANTTSSSPGLAERYPVDYREHEGTRLENDRLLLPISDEIRSGKNIEHLDRFAKAYLGLFLDIDNTIPPNDRINILANPELAAEIKSGFEAILAKESFPGPEQIADSIYEDAYPEGYVLLAALDLFSDDPRYDFGKLSSKTIVAAICFHYAYQTEIQDKWFISAMQNNEKDVIRAFSRFWQQLIRHNTDHLPGLYQFIDHHKYDHLSKQLLLPVLATWTTVRKKILSKLLHTAIRTSDHDKMLAVCKTALDSWNAAEPGRYILWLASAFILAPEQYEAILLDYSGRSKEKIIPLMDFVYLIFNDSEIHNLKMNSQALATLLRIIAPKVTPQEDRYGQICDNTRKVMYLFYLLATSRQPEKSEPDRVIKQLKQVRVMKLYTPVLDFVQDLQQASTALTFDQFVKQLIERQLIKSKIKRYD